MENRRPSVRQGSQSTRGMASDGQRSAQPRATKQSSPEGTAEPVRLTFHRRAQPRAPREQTLRLELCNMLHVLERRGAHLCVLKERKKEKKEMYLCYFDPNDPVSDPPSIAIL